MDKLKEELLNGGNLLMTICDGNEEQAVDIMRIVNGLLSDPQTAKELPRVVEIAKNNGGDIMSAFMEIQAENLFK